MQLNIVPLWCKETELTDRDYTLFEDVKDYILDDSDLREIFDNYSIRPRIDILEPSKLVKKNKEILVKIFSTIFFPDEPYYVSGMYTTRYLEEIAEKQKWDEILGRTLAITNAFTCEYKLCPLNPKIVRYNGRTIGPKSVVISAVSFNYDPFSIYKEAKHELGHTFGLSHECPNGNTDLFCIMNYIEVLEKRDTIYCSYCNEKKDDFLRKEQSNLYMS